MTVSTCLICKHYINNGKCNAFQKIPNEILDGENNHSKPLPNQTNDIVFEPINNDASK